MKSLLRTRSVYCDVMLVLLYRSHLLAFLEYKTPAIYHARRGVLIHVDNVQHRFLRDADELTALVNFNLAPFGTRRDIAMLGLVHRTFLGSFRKHFRLEGPADLVGRCCHFWQLLDPRLELRGNIITRSALGLAAIYNMLPEYVVMVMLIDIS